jgi:tetratricopeptide (TPR) repeat protein
MRPTVRRDSVGRVPERRRASLAGALAVAGGLVLAAFFLISYRLTPVPPPDDAATRAAPEFVGHAACVECHRAEGEAWRGSQHAQAMQPATPGTMLGRFDDVRFTHDGVTSTFFRRDQRYFVRTDGPDGAAADFELAYTFGVSPLQQYLIAFPDGRMQALSIAWDARPEAAGGGRWFHLYPDEHIDHRDELHWTRPSQNWNYVCADCHSTNLRRNYDLAADRYATTWSDVGVGCESCHGAGSRHVAWTEKRPGTERLARKGLVIALDERRGVTWPPTAAGNASRSVALASQREVDTCGVCHARRRSVGADPNPTGRLLDTHVPVLLEPLLYHPDGQQLEEVYTYGSFLQSKMFAHGVTCSDCHEPHTQKLRAPGNAVCAQCHVPAKYDVEAHLLHRPGSPGAQCAACHMPTRTYMEIDARHDHSLRIPRPDLSERFGVPNACGSCHRERGAAWAAGVIARAHGPERKGFQTFVDALHAGRTGEPGAADKLAALARDGGAPAIARATAVSDLRRFPGSASRSAIERALGDRDGLVRLAALDALQPLPPQARAPFAVPLADDALKAVRVEAGRVLAGARLDGLPPARRDACERALAEYVASEAAMAERPEAHLNLGTFYAEQHDVARAQAEYRTAIRRQADFVPAYVNLADLYRALDRDAEAAAVLSEGLRIAPDAPSLLHALGLERVREKRLDEALPLLARAAERQPDNARFAYVHAVALHSTGKAAEAMAVLDRALARAPYDRELLFALATFNRDAGRLPAARRYAARLAAVAPDDEGVRGLVRDLGAD